MKAHILRFVLIFGILCPEAPAAWATQTHGGPEGLYAHQIGHIIFILAMGILVYWLSDKTLMAQKGWRYIRYAAFFFVLWNVDAFFIHFLDEQTEWIRIERVDLWHIRIQSLVAPKILGVLYYLAKLDHLICVPALLFLFAGLRRLLKESPALERRP